MEETRLNLQNVIEVFQDGNIEKVNQYLSLGWVLLNVHTTDYGHPVERHQSTQFSLGWYKENGQVQKPKNPYSDLIDAWNNKADSKDHDMDYNKEESF